MPNGPHTRPSIEKAAWVAEAVRLSIRGWSLRRIGLKFGLHHSTVAEALDAEFERVRPQEAEVQRRREVLSEQIEEQIAAWRPRSRKGDKDAALALSRFWDRYAKLWGLDAPTKTEHTGADGAPIVINVSSLDDEQLRIAAADDAGDEDGASGGRSGGAGAA